MLHTLITSKRNRGGSPIAGMRGHSGTNASCSCGTWKNYTNEGPPSRSKAWATRAHEAHVAETTHEGDLKILVAKMSQAAKAAQTGVEEEWMGSVRANARLLLDLAEQYEETIQLALAEQAVARDA